MCVAVPYLYIELGIHYQAVLARIFTHVLHLVFFLIGIFFVLFADVNIESPPSMHPCKRICDITGFEVYRFFFFLKMASLSGLSAPFHGLHVFLLLRSGGCSTMILLIPTRNETYSYPCLIFFCFSK